MKLEDVPVYIVDTETTGLDAKHHAACEIALMRWIPSTQEETLQAFEWSSFVHPGRAIPKEATRIHGITDEDVKDAPSREDVFATVNRLLPKNALVLAHNMSFDAKFLKLDGYALGCTLKLARYLWPQAPSHKNAELARWLNIQISGEKLHRALADVKVTAQIFQRIVQTLMEKERVMPSCEWIIEKSWTSAEVDTMPFGKYRGQCLKDIPADYLDYALATWKNADASLRSALEKARQLRLQVPERISH